MEQSDKFVFPIHDCQHQKCFVGHLSRQALLLALMGFAVGVSGSRKLVCPL